MTNNDRDRPSLKDFDAYTDRNGQDNGQDSPLDLARPDQTQAHLKRDPMGEAETARLASGVRGDDATDATEAETPPETIRRLSDATLSSKDKDATEEAIAHAATASQKPGETR
jgi:hypothetical protein